jgi:regulator of replication initiation timing
MWQKTALLLGFFLCLSAAILQAYIRTETTFLGYEIGKLKTQEIELLKERSLLTMEVAKLTTKENLQRLLQQPSTSNRKHDTTE